MSEDKEKRKSQIAENIREIEIIREIERIKELEESVQHERVRRGYDFPGDDRRRRSTRIIGDDDEDDDFSKPTNRLGQPDSE
ncbi:hypothetical protein [Roseobacter sinensis]|uniref:Uncharacterized protein n=1 Tax=Roseobacter sinensis TaxID=2931391 RepID=A0ABT3BA76_9RHOB|nr:hypothetical protein [Roseobacter sp. WL0113]MCV3270445.1 hypothetical protein [Roseobacter sp. WL0113]